MIVTFNNKLSDNIKTYEEDNNFIVEVMDVDTTKELIINCRGKDIEINAVRIINDYYLTSYACILICRNGNPAKKEGIAYAQAYFSLFDYKYSLEI